MVHTVLKMLCRIVFVIECPDFYDFLAIFTM